jgi:hypothetical protein
MRDFTMQKLEESILNFIICELIKGPVRTQIYIASNDRIIESAAVERILKQAVVAYFGFYTGNCLGQPNKTTIPLSKNRRCSG